ncbi:MAG: zf-HC2 domain-containing protein [Lachnospiraceae bacterium]|jgi:hypothetical protein|nr:zf-HC2 domain-containing protein [Lachnospiraceae bacterium]
MRTRRKGRWLPKQPRLGAGMCQGTFIFYERRLCDMTDLDCKQTEKLIPQFLKDELDNRTEKKFLNHVDGCSSCLEELSIQFLVTTGMQRLENGDTFDLNRELRMRIDTEKRHLHILSSLQHGLYATEAMAILAATMILTMVVL